MQTVRDRLIDLHSRLEAHYDIDRWHWRDWTPPLDICLGAILVQHTAWTNVEKALQGLRDGGLYALGAIAAADEAALAVAVRPAGTPQVKARRLRTFAVRVLEAGGFEALFAMPAGDLRAFLLATPGIGPETADVICLYGARLPVVVHDAYTARLFRRLGLGPEGRDSYETWSAWLHEALPIDARLRRRHHAAIVVHCKELCRARPKCNACPLLDCCPFGREWLVTAPPRPPRGSR